MNEIQDQISELNLKLRDGKLFDKQGMLSDSLQRFQNKNETFQQMKTDIDKLIKRNTYQVDVYGQNDDLLEQAIDELKSIKERFVMALDGYEDDDDDESTYYHFFLKTSVQIRKSKLNLTSLIGIQQLFDGFEQICEILHVNNQQPVQEICQLVIEICSELIEWMYDLRELESDQIQQKSNFNKKLINTIQDQIDKSQIDLQKLQEEISQLKYEIEQLNQTRDFQQNRLTSKQQELSELTENCQYKQFDLDREKERMQRQNQLTYFVQIQ